MKLGCFSILFNDMPLPAVLDYFSSLKLDAIELGVGGYSKSKHVNVDEILANPVKGKELKEQITSYGLFISALGAHGNPVHPDTALSKQHHEEFIKACRLAEIIGVDTLLLASGCPGGAPGDKTPNWITCPWPDDFLKASKYQWEDVLIPYWSDAVKLAREYGINKLAIEMHPGMSVYNVATLLRLRNSVGKEIGCNFDPSHLIWQGMEPAQAIMALGDSIFHIHAKDTQINEHYVKINGVLDAKHYSDLQNRSWTFRTVGYGIGEKGWKDIVSALATIGYDYVLSIEHEDVLMSKKDGFEKAVKTLDSILIREKSSGMWWA